MTFLQAADERPGIVPPEDDNKDADFGGALNLPPNRKARKSLEAAADFLKESAWGEAVHVLQALLNAPEDSFVKVRRARPEGGESVRWCSVRSEANHLLGTMPAHGLELYELQFGARARERLAEAKRQSDPQLLAEVAERYLHTKAGAEAANLLGTHHLDRARPVMAALCFERLLAREITATPLTLLKATLAYRQAGDPTRAAETWRRLARLSPTGVRLGTRTVPLTELRQAMDALASAVGGTNPFDWLMFRGGPDRQARSDGDVPYLDEDEHRWAQPTIRHSQTRQWLEQALASHENRQAPAVVPAFFPIAAAGKVVFRSYFGLHAVDSTTGKLLWEQGSDGSLDRLVTDAAKMVPLSQWVQLYLQGSAQNVLFENSTLGALSTDNNLVFAVDDLAIPPHPQAVPSNMRWRGLRATVDYGPLEPVVHHNRLQGIELATGKLKWCVGGRGEGGELNDSFFLGPPLPLGGKLYVLVEKNSELRLVCLEAASGAQNWIQSLATVRDPILRDVGRRMHAVHLAYGDGILLCPTNAGALLGVDLLTHSLVWAHSYREGPAVADVPPATVRGKAFALGTLSLSPDWKCSAPLIHQNRVLFTAPDGSSLHCLNLRDGTPLWKASRNDDLYLGAVAVDKVLLVGQRSCRALSLVDGKQVWTLETGLPSGQGVASGGTYYLPLKSATQGGEPEVCALDIDAGRIVGRVRNRHKKEIPGNLLFFDGQVISQTVHQLTAYPQLRHKIAQLDERLRINPRDPIGLHERGVLRLNRGDLPGAAVDLRNALAHQPDAAQRSGVRVKLYETLTELLHRDFGAGEKYLDEYRELCRVAAPEGASPEQRQEAQREQERRQTDCLRLVAQGREGQGRLGDALRTYLEFATLSRTRAPLTLLDEPSVQVRPDVWAHGRLAALVARAAPEQRKVLDEEVARHWRDVSTTADIDKLRRHVALFGPLLAGEGRLQLAERLSEQDAGGHGFLEAELLLLQARRHPHSAYAGRATEMLARLLTRKGLVEDAAVWYRVMGRDFAQMVLRDGKTGADILNDLATDKRFLPFLDADPPLRRGSISVKETTGVFPAPLARLVFVPRGELPPFFQHHAQAVTQLTFLDRRNQVERWLSSVKFGNTQGRYYLAGHLMVLHYGTMIYGVDPVGRQILWERSLVSNEPPKGSQLMVDDEGAVQLLHADGKAQKLGQVVLVTPGFICLHTHEGLVALEPLNGTVLWTKSDVPSLAHIFGDEQHLFYLEIQARGLVGIGRALRAQDGTAVAVPDFAELYGRKILTLGHCLLLADVHKHSGATLLRCHDILTGKDLWSKEFAAESRVLRSEAPGFVAVLEPKRGVVVLDLNTRQELVLAVNPQDLDKANGHLLCDRKHFYLALEREADPFFAEVKAANIIGVRSLPIHGDLLAFDRADGRLRWKIDVPQQVLILEQFDDMPFILCASRLLKREKQPAAAVLGFDKHTGKLLYRKEWPGGIQFHALTLNAPGTRAELVAPNLKIEFHLGEEAAR